MNFVAPSMIMSVFAAGMNGIPLVDIPEPRNQDVLCGRGGASLKHPGNQTYRELVHMHKAYYTRCQKSDKLKISRSIVATVRQQHGRFLERDGIKGTWYDIGDKKAVEKTSQALREGQPKLRLQIEMGGGNAGIELKVGPVATPPMLSPSAIQQQKAQLQMAQQRLLAQQRVIQQQMAQQRMAEQQAAQQQLLRRQMAQQQMVVARQQVAAQNQVQQLAQRAYRLAQQQAQAQAEELEKQKAKLLQPEQALKLAQEKGEKLAQEHAKLEAAQQTQHKLTMEQAKQLAQTQNSMREGNSQKEDQDGALHNILMNRLNIAQDDCNYVPTADLEGLPGDQPSTEFPHSGAHPPLSMGPTISFTASGESDFGESDEGIAPLPFPEASEKTPHPPDDLPRTIPILSTLAGNAPPQSTGHQGASNGSTHSMLLDHPTGSFSAGHFSFSGRSKGDEGGDSKQGQQQTSESSIPKAAQHSDGPPPTDPNSHTMRKLDRRRIFAKMKYNRPASSGRLNKSNASMDDGMPDVHMVGSTFSLLSNVSSRQEMKAEDMNGLAHSDPKLRDDYGLGSRRSLMSGLSRVSGTSDAHSMFSDLARKIGNISMQSIAMSEISGIEEGNHEDLDESFHLEAMATTKKGDTPFDSS